MKRFIFVTGALAIAASLTASPVAAQDNPPPSATVVPKAKSSDAYKLITPGATKKVTFGELQEFQHPSGVFTIQVPENWSAQDATTDDEAMVFFLDPSKNAAIIARAIKVEGAPDDEAMGEILKTFVDNQFGALKSFDAAEPKKMKDGSMGLGFSFDATTGGKTYTMYGDAYQLLNDTVGSTLVLIAPKDQYEGIRDKAYEILNSYTANPDAMNAAPASEDIIGELELYKGPKGAFQIMAPVGWEAKNQSKAGTSSIIGWVEPNGKAELVVEVYKDSKTYKGADLQKLVEAYVEDSYGNQPNMKMGDSKANANNSAQTTATFDLEVGDETIPMVAVLYVDKVQGALAYMRIAVPVASLDAITDKMDEIGNSYKITKNPKL
jgi:hypothetical protein